MLAVFHNTNNLKPTDMVNDADAPTKTVQVAMETISVNITSITAISGNQGDVILVSWVTDKDACKVADGFVLKIKQKQDEKSPIYRTVAIPCDQR